MKKIKLLVFMMLGTSCVFQSCKTDLEEIKAVSNETVIDRRKYDVNLVDESIKEDFKIVDGILHFRDFETFRKVKDGLDKLTMKEKLAFIETKGFNSRLINTQKVLEKIRNAKSLEDRENLIKENGEVVTLDKEKFPISKNLDDCTSTLVTNEGMVYIGKILYMFTPDREYIVYDGDKTKLSGFRNGRVANESAELSIINTTNIQPRTNKNARICNSLSGFVKSTAPNSDKYARTFTIVDAPIYSYTGNNQYTVSVHSYSKGVAMHPDEYGNIGYGLGVEYETWNWLSINYSVKMYIGNPYGSTINVPYTFSDSRTRYECGTDFHFYSYAYNQPSSAMNNVIAYVENTPDANPPYQSFEHRYNHADLGNNQFLYPGCY